MTANLKFSEYVLSLATPEARLETVGGKGASLARLAAADLPVPDGFHVTTAVYRQIVTTNNLQPRILAALQGADTVLPATLETASQTIQALFAQADIPEDVVTAIVHTYRELPGDDPVVAVRSSATAEDLPGLSFAGQQETYLNIQGETAVLDAVRRCWASLWTPRAIGYRMRNDIDQNAVSLAVVVQLLVSADAAGILFTANPVNGRRDQAVISAAWGLGEAVVGGLVTPDSLIVEKVNGRVQERRTADKEVMTVRVAGGTEERPVPENRRMAQVLDDQQAAALVRLGVQIEALYGMPMDIEWALQDGTFAIVQARPITALPEPEARPPMEWPLPKREGQFLRGSAAELLPDPMCPLFETMGVAALDAGTRHLFSGIISEPPDEIAQIIYTINGYAFMNTQFSRKQWFMATTLGLVRIYRLIKNGAAHWRDVMHPQYAAVLERLRARPVVEMSAAELLDGARELTRLGMLTYNSLQSGIIPASTTSETVFTKVYEKFVQREGDPSALTFILGFNSMPIRAEKSLYDVGVWAAQGDLADYLQQTPAMQIASALAEAAPPADLPDEIWAAFRERFNEHLAQYGHTIYDLDFVKPTPADDPTPLLETLKVYVGGQGNDPHRRQAALAEKREAAMAAVRARYRRGLRRWLFEKTVGWARTAIPLREEGLADIGLGWPLLREMLLEIGRRAVAAGLLDRPDEIFWLREGEVETAVAALDRDENPDSMNAAVTERKALWRARKQVIPPSILPPKSKFLGIDVEKWMPARVNQEDANKITGVGASPGRITGTARVLHGPEDFGRMQSGDILVAAITTPAWTPLFALATAVVTDIGGPLSHSSIVAREYGIPAVLGTGVATKRIISGQTITVDGAEGVVLLANGN
ncbi:MAG: hypothetical protein KC421_10590 [Anaerolineales bacterium]|nr:hypothetical protein [Anaerolineales bacterium]